MGNATVKTPIINPAYKEFALCPCDLVVKVCDVDCCCDQVYTVTFDVSLWSYNLLCSYSIEELFDLL